MTLPGSLCYQKSISINKNKPKVPKVTSVRKWHPCQTVTPVLIFGRGTPFYGICAIFRGGREVLAKEGGSPHMAIFGGGGQPKVPKNGHPTTGSPPRKWHMCQKMGDPRRLALVSLFGRMVSFLKDVTFWHFVSYSSPLCNLGITSMLWCRQSKHSISVKISGTSNSDILCMFYLNLTD